MIPADTFRKAVPNGLEFGISLQVVILEEDSPEVLDGR